MITSSSQLTKRILVAVLPQNNVRRVLRIGKYLPYSQGYTQSTESLYSVILEFMELAQQTVTLFKVAPNVILQMSN
jgi:hypothetical protein